MKSQALLASTIYVYDMRKSNYAVSPQARYYRRRKSEGWKGVCYVLPPIIHEEIKEHIAKRKRELGLYDVPLRSSTIRKIA